MCRVVLVSSYYILYYRAQVTRFNRISPKIIESRIKISVNSNFTLRAFSTFPFQSEKCALVFTLFREYWDNQQIQWVQVATNNDKIFAELRAIVIGILLVCTGIILNFHNPNNNAKNMHISNWINFPKLWFKIMEFKTRNAYTDQSS